MQRKTLTDRLIQSAACSRRFLDAGSQGDIARFILAQQNPDGGFRGRDSKSDLYYTVFAVASLKALGQPIPAWKVWKYTRSFGLGDGLDLVHLVCLIRLKASFPMFGSTRRKLFKQLERHSGESAYGLFLKLLAEDYLDSSGQVQVSLTDPTTSLAASLIVDEGAPAESNLSSLVADELLSRASPAGGFVPSKQIEVPDLLSTATALFALTSIGTVLEEGLQVACFKFIESLWRDSGGFAGHVSDEFEDAEYSFYALLAIGCLIQSMAKDYGSKAGT